MAMQLEAPRVNSDSPPYPIVEACEHIGLTRPADVRWCPVSRLVLARAGWLGYMADRVGEAWSGAARTREVTCSCGQPLVWLRKCRFTLDSGRRAVYHIGQCDRCLTVYWDHE
jgi:hypothetical protein